MADMLDHPMSSIRARNLAYQGIVHTSFAALARRESRGRLPEAEQLEMLFLLTLRQLMQHQPFVPPDNLPGSSLQCLLTAKHEQQGRSTI